MSAVTLAPDLERFAEEAVASGRYRNVSDVVRAGIDLLRRAEVERASLIASLEQAQAEGERDGFSTIEDVQRETDAILEAAGLHNA